MRNISKTYVQKKQFGRKPQGGFTLIEILVVIGMIAVLAAVVLIAINPLRQFAQARNSQRISNVNAILNAIGNRIAENKGIFIDTTTCTVVIPTTATTIGKGSSQYDMRPCMVPTFISELPFDPKDGSNTCTSATCTGSGESYDTKYTVAQDSTTGRITICAPGALESAISGSSSYCLTR
jgi:prepilin-type N-terminal cleavage/methylation domain-containing protein